MTALQIATRLCAQPCGKGRWSAKCPSHNDNSPSLSIAEGSDGRALLYCHAGCTIDVIARALGIEIRELFADDARPPWRSPQARRKTTTGEILVALQGEAELYRKARGIDGTLLTNELNAIRRAVARRLGVTLDDLPRPLHEGSYGGRERDPAWPTIFEWALITATVELLGFPIAFDETLPPPRMILLAAEERAAAAMRSLESEERRPRGHIAV